MADMINYSNREKVMAKGGFQPEPKSGYSNDVFAIVVSVGLIFGGLSGRMVLRGTDSSPALVVAGFVFLAWDIFSIFRKKNALQKAEQERYARSSRMYDLEKAVAKDERALPAQVNVRIVWEKSFLALDFGPRLNGYAMNRDVKSREYTGATSRVHNILCFDNLDLTVIFDADLDAREITIDLFRDGAGIGVALPECVTLIDEKDA